MIPVSAWGFSYLRAEPGPRFLLAPKVYTGDLWGPVGEGASIPSWHIAQWGIRQELPTQTDCLDDCTNGIWQIQNDDAAVRVFMSPTQGRVVELAQDSMHPDYGCGEFDLFLEPNEEHVYPRYQSAFGPLSGRPTLAQQTRIVFAIVQEVLSATAGRRCAPYVDLAGVGFAFISLNTAVTPRQVLYYQIVTYDSRGLTFDAFWFAAGMTGTGGHEFGVSDSVQILGFAPLTPGGGAVGYRMDILPRLRALIAAGPPGLERDLTKWQLRGMYLGSGTNGAAKIVSRHAQIFLSGDE
jgi:hypothetical protein